MQDCFRQHPEMYGSELEDDDDEVEEELRAREADPASGDDVGDDAPQPSPQKAAEPMKETPRTTDQKAPPPEPKSPSPESHSESSKRTASKPERSGDEGGELLPKAAHDATSKNE